MTDIEPDSLDSDKDLGLSEDSLEYNNRKKSKGSVDSSGNPIDPNVSGPLANSTMITDAPLSTLPPPDISIIEGPTGPIGPVKDMNKIISETIEIVDAQQKNVRKQRTTLSQMAFMLHRVRESLQQYEQHIDKLNNFLVNNEGLQSEWYIRYCQEVPQYGDYDQVLKNSPEPLKVDELPSPVPEGTLKELSMNVVNTLYACGAHIKGQRLTCKNIHKTVASGKEFCKTHMMPFNTWFNLLNLECANQIKLSENLFQISAFIDFLKSDMNAEPLAMDLSNISSGNII